LGGVVHRVDVHGHGVGRRGQVHPEVGGTPVVADLEVEGGVAGPVGVGGRGELELAARDVGHGDLIAGRHRRPVVLERAPGGQAQGGHLDRGQVVGRGVVGVGEPEITGGEGVGDVLVGAHGVVGALGGVVHRVDVHGHGVGRRGQVHPEVGGTPVVADLEVEGGVAGPVGVGGRGELELAARDVGHGGLIAGQHRRPVVLERAPGGQAQGGHLDRGQVVGRGVVGVGEPEITGGEGVGDVLVGAHGVVGALGGVVHRVDVHGHGVGRRGQVHPEVGGTPVVADLEVEGGVAGPVGVGGRGELELAARDVG